MEHGQTTIERRFEQLPQNPNLPSLQQHPETIKSKTVESTSIQQQQPQPAARQQFPVQEKHEERQREQITEKPQQSVHREQRVTHHDEPSTANKAVEQLRQRALVTQEKLDQLKHEIPRAVEEHWRQLQTNVPRSAGELWDKLPYVWRYTLFSDAFIFWPLLGGLMLLYPLKALEYHASLANYFGWAGPTPTLASNSLILYVQALGATLLSLAVLAGYGYYRNDGMLARVYSLMRLVLAGGLLYAVFFGHPKGTVFPGKTSTVYYALVPFALHSLWGAGAILTSGPEFWRKMLGRVPRHLQ